MGSPYPNDAGSKGQKNNAHFIELAGALAIIDFLGIPDGSLTCEAGKAVRPIYKEFSTLLDADNLKYSDFEDYTRRKLNTNLSQLTLFAKFLEEHLQASMATQAWSKDNPVIDQHFLDDSFYATHLSEFIQAFREWLQEMSINRRGLTPFNLSASVASFIQDRTGKAGLFKRNFESHDFDDQLTGKARPKTGYSSQARKFLKLFFDTTKQILESNFGLNN
jgi:hypothetical protein